jgi:hypothetical protein
MTLRSRCPHCRQSEPIEPGTDTQSAWRCQSCGQVYVPHRHLFVADRVTRDGPDAQAATRARPASGDTPAPDAAPLTTAIRRGPRRWLWAVVCLLLALGLMSQVAWTQRNLWAAQWPATRPVWQSMCDLLACRLEAPELIRAIDFVSSGFDQQDNGTFLLSIELRHDRPYAVAMPHIELTLTDVQDRPVLRKVFEPAQLGLQPNLPSGAGIKSETAWALDPDLYPHASGFRIEIFYP